jgi:hypothetical protein
MTQGSGGSRTGRRWCVFRGSTSCQPNELTGPRSRGCRENGINWKYSRWWKSKLSKAAVLVSSAFQSNIEIVRRPSCRDTVHERGTWYSAAGNRDT